MDLTHDEVRTVRVALAYWREQWRPAPQTDGEVAAELRRIAGLLERLATNASRVAG